MTRLGRILDLLMGALAFLGGALLIFALLAVCLDVIMRYFFNSPISWVLQVSEYILLYVPFLAAAYVLKQDGHIRVDILLNRLSPKTQTAFNLGASILGVLIISVVTYYGAKVTWEQYRDGIVTIEHVKMPQFMITLAIPLGSALFSIQFVRRAVGYYRRLKSPE